MRRVREARRGSYCIRGRPIAESRLATPVSLLNPLEDERWPDFLERHPRASVFHSRGWLEALKRTYGFEPLAFTTGGAKRLANGLVVCQLRTAVSRRLVSLPFSDHCDPLAGSAEELQTLVGYLANEVSGGRWRRVELRPRSSVPIGLPESAGFWLHTLDLTPPEQRIFERFHPSHTQRGIRRGEREGLTYESGSSSRLISSFYALLRLTRRRHGLPPQPLSWFQNLVACMGETLKVHMASKDGIPVAAILTLSFKKTLVYKYGGSDARHHRLGGMPFLFWRAIQEAKAKGLEELDLGRSDLDQAGLIAFKEHLGATRSELRYYSHPTQGSASELASRVSHVARRILPYLPDAALDLTGRLLYKHLG